MERELRNIFRRFISISGCSLLMLFITGPLLGILNGTNNLQIGAVTLCSFIAAVSSLIFISKKELSSAEWWIREIVCILLNSAVILPVTYFAGLWRSLIQIPTDDGMFTYQLPVYYLKPSLKLTSTKGTMKINGGEQTVSTKVTEKKSTGLYEDIDVSDAITLVDWKNTAYAPADKASDGAAHYDVDGATVSFTATVGAKGTAKGNGKIQVQKENWAEPVKLSYSVAENTKNVLTGSVKQLTFNNNSEATQDQEFTLFYNGSEDLNSEDPVTVTTPKNWGDANIEGLDETTLSSSAITLKFKEGTHKKGNYSLKFTTKDKASFTLKVVVSDAKLEDKAITLQYKTKANTTLGQKGVVVPKFAGVAGPIESVSTSNEKITAEYNEVTNQIIVTPEDTSVVGKANLTFTMTTATGVECKTTIKNFEVLAKNPTVKIAKLTLPKTKVMSEDGASGEANVLSTIKNGGKVFAVAPTKVEFYNGNTLLTPNDSGVYTVKNATFELTYNESDGLLEVKSYKEPTGKKTTVNVRLYYNGNESKPVKSSLTINTK